MSGNQIVQASQFPTVGETMELVRSIVNDTLTGIDGQQGRIFTNDAPFTLPFLNSALRKIQRFMRNEGATFPVIDGVILENLVPVVAQDTGVFVSVGFDGYNNGTMNYTSPRLPSDCMQVKEVRQRVNGSGLNFSFLPQAQAGLLSTWQGPWMGSWEWRGYKIWLNGSTNAQDLMIRYLQGQPPINAPAEDFDETPIYIIDCQDAVANLMAAKFGAARGASPASIKSCLDDAQEAMDEMANEYIRRSQGVNYSRQSYQGGGSSNQNGGMVGSAGIGN